MTVEAAIVTANCLKKLAGNPADERRGDEHGAKREGDRDQGATDLVHRAMRGLARRQALTQVALDVLDDDDRVIDDDADRQH